MKVLMINSFHHPRGGDATYTRSLSNLLEANGHEVVPLAMRHPENVPSPWEHRFINWVDPHGTHGLPGRIRMATRALWSGEAARSCRRIIDEVRPDVAHLQHVHRHLTPSVLDPLNAAGIPVIWTVHDHELICPSGHLFTQGRPCERCLGHRYTEAIRYRCKWDALLPSIVVAAEKMLHRLKNVWNRVDRFVCPSRFLAETLVRFGLPADRVLHQPNFIDMKDHALARGHGSGWLVAGRLAVEKGVDVAIEAARGMPDLPLWICGSGPEEIALRRQARGLAHVHFMGHLSPQALAARIRAARIVAVPSRWYENFPYAVLESQAAGRAVVASAIGGIPEQIDPGNDGILVPPNDATALAKTIRVLHDEPERCHSLGRAGRKRVRKELNPNVHLQRVLDIYQTVMR